MKAKCAECAVVKAAKRCIKLYEYDQYACVKEHNGKGCKRCLAIIALEKAVKEASS